MILDGTLKKTHNTKINKVTKLNIQGVLKIL